MKVLQKVTNVVNFAREQGFVIKELEIEEDDEEEDKEDDEENKKDDEDEDD